MGTYRDACNSGRFVISGEVGPPKGESFEATSDFIVSYDDSDPAMAYSMVKEVSQAYLDVFAEIARTVPAYAGLTYSKLGASGVRLS